MVGVRDGGLRLKGGGSSRHEGEEGKEKRKMDVREMTDDDGGGQWESCQTSEGRWGQYMCRDFGVGKIQNKMGIRVF